MATALQPAHGGRHNGSRAAPPSWRPSTLARRKTIANLGRLRVMNEVARQREHSLQNFKSGPEILMLNVQVNPLLVLSAGSTGRGAVSGSFYVPPTPGKGGL